MTCRRTQGHSALLIGTDQHKSNQSVGAEFCALGRSSPAVGAALYALQDREETQAVHFPAPASRVLTHSACPACNLLARCPANTLLAASLPCLHATRVLPWLHPAPHPNDPAPPHASLPAPCLHSHPAPFPHVACPQPALPAPFTSTMPCPHSACRCLALGADGTREQAPERAPRSCPYLSSSRWGGSHRTDGGAAGAAA